MLRLIFGKLDARGAGGALVPGHFGPLIYARPLTNIVWVA